MNEYIADQKDINWIRGNSSHGIYQIEGVFNNKEYYQLQNSKERRFIYFTDDGKWALGGDPMKRNPYQIKALSAQSGLNCPNEVKKWITQNRGKPDNDKMSFYTYSTWNLHIERNLTNIYCVELVTESKFMYHEASGSIVIRLLSRNKIGKVFSSKKIIAKLGYDSKFTVCAKHPVDRFDIRSYKGQDWIGFAKFFNRNLTGFESVLVDEADCSSKCKKIGFGYELLATGFRKARKFHHINVAICPSTRGNIFL